MNEDDLLNNFTIGTGSATSSPVFEPNRLSTGSIIGIGVGAGAGLLALIAFMTLCCRCYRRQKTSPKVWNHHHHSSYSRPHNLTLGQARQKGPTEVQTATHQNIIPGTNMSTLSEVGGHDLPQIPLSPLSTAQDMSGARSWDDLRGRGRNWL